MSLTLGMLTRGSASAAGPTILGHTKFTSLNLSSHAVPLPAGVKPGELLLCFCTLNKNVAPTFPTGWSPAYGYSVSLRTGSVTHRVSAKIADGTEGSSVTFTTSNPADVATVAVRVGNNRPRLIYAATGVTDYDWSVWIGSTNALNSFDAVSTVNPFTASESLWFHSISWRDGVSPTISAYPAGWDLINDQVASATSAVALSAKNFTTSPVDPGPWQFTAAQGGGVYMTVGIRGK